MVGVNRVYASESVPSLALSIALEHHPALSSSPQVLCAAARACKAWRQAVQQCAVCNTAVVLDPSKQLQQLHSFAQWLPKHAALVDSITAVADAAIGDFEEPEEDLWQSHLEATQQLLRALHAAAVADEGATPGPGAAAAALPASSGAELRNSTQQQQQQQQHGWRLASFSSDLPGAPALLHVLPAHSLTHLDLQLQPGAGAEEASAELSQLTRLSSLQQLHLGSSHRVQYQLPDGCLAGLAQLSQLTSLKLTGVWRGIKQQLQQLLVQPLPLQQLVLVVMDRALHSSGQDQDLPDLAHLTQLTHLSLGSCGVPSTLPAQLQVLHAGSQCTDLAAVLALKQLQCLTLSPELAEQRQLLELAKLPALQELHLYYNGPVDAAAAASNWKSLPQLRGLDVQSWYVEAPSRQQIAAILAGAAAATQLTQLQLSLPCADAALLQGHVMPMCGSLAGLTRLKEMRLHRMRLVPGDALALTPLTGLTRLELYDLHDGVGEVAATALACSLKHLQHLECISCSVNLGSTEFLAAVGQLKQLTYLNLRGNDGLTQQGVMQLTGLSRLQRLHVDLNEEVTDEVWDGFWAAVRQQQQQQLPAGSC
uniref:F-box domain-containing protein n=1 Tax=Tetradesmus obliquus TaxID=3088 RepID=A0A383W9B4_TETOB|eukprot:jgi/Sobl393_1/15801/SZX73604.1